MGRQPVLQDYGNIQNPPADNDYQMETLRNMQRDKEQRREFEYKNKQDKQKGQGDGIDFITGLKPEHVGDTTIDLHTDAQVKGLQDKLMAEALKGTGVNELKMMAMPELQKISQGHTIAKDEYAKVVNGVKDFSKDYPTADMEAVRNLAGKEMLNNVFEYNEDGTVKGYKDPSLISKDKNYLENLTTNENLPKWYRRSDAMEKGVKSLPLIPIKGGTTRTDKKGGRIKQTYTGHGSVFDEPVMNDGGEQSGWRLKSEAVPLGRNPDGSVIIESVMPKEQFDLMLPTPAARLDFELDFNKYLEESGVNPDKLDPRAKDTLERKYALDLLSKTGLHGSSFLTTDEIKEAPIKNVTNVRVNTGKEAPPVIDVYATIKEKADERNNPETHKPVNVNGKMVSGLLQANLLDDNEQAVVMEKARKASSGDANIGIDDIYIQSLPDGVWIFRAEDNKPLTKMTPTGTNVSANTPLGQKSKQQAVKDATEKATSGYVWNGNTYTEDEINEAAKAEKMSRDAYLKKHGIKKK